MFRREQKGREGMNAYEYVDNGGRVLCKNHHKLRCDECEYTYDLEQQNKRYKRALLEIMQMGELKQYQTGRMSYNYQGFIAENALKGDDDDL